MNGTVLREQLQSLPLARRWLIATRLKTVGLSITPVLCGCWLASRHVDVRPGLAFAASLSAVAIQVGTNLWNDAADAERGTDTVQRLGPPRLTSMGLLDGRHVKIAAMLAFFIACAAGLPLVLLGGWPIVAIGLSSLLLGYAYSMGPLPLSHTPFGELIVLAFFGVVAVTGTVHVLGAEVTAQAVWHGIMIGLPSAGVLLLNNHRDRATDAAAGRRTLAILAGISGARLIYAGLVLAPVVILALLVTPSAVSAVLVVLAFGYACFLASLLWRTPVSADINRCLPLTVSFQFFLLVALILSTLAVP